MQSDQITQVLIVALIFGAAAFVLRSIVDAFVRYKALREGVAGETATAVHEAERAVARTRALRWGLLGVCDGAALLVIHLLHLPPNSAAALACLFLGVGVSQLAFVAMTRARRE